MVHFTNLATAWHVQDWKRVRTSPSVAVIATAVSIVVSLATPWMSTLMVQRFLAAIRVVSLLTGEGTFKFTA